MFGSLDNYLASPTALRCSLRVIHISDDAYSPLRLNPFDNLSDSLTLIKVKVRKS
jgi:hypothetical protein